MTWIKRHGFAVLWSAAAVAALLIYLLWYVQADFLGIVETRAHKLGSPEAGRVREVLVSLGDTVRANDVLIQLDTSDLDAREQSLRNEIARLDGSLGADRRRYALESDRIALDRSSSQANLSRRRAERESKRAELAALEEEIARLSEVEKAGLGRPRDLADLRIRREAAARWLAIEASADLSGSLGVRGGLDGADAPESMMVSLLGEHSQRVEELRLERQVVLSRLDRRRVIAPCDGRVVNLNYLPGDAVDAFASIVTVEEPVAEFIDAYIPESSDQRPQIGQRVAIYPHRLGKVDARGTVIFIDPGYSAVPPRLTFRGIEYWARKFRIRLDPGHRLMPGEAVQVRLLRERLPASSLGGKR